MKKKISIAGIVWLWTVLSYGQKDIVAGGGQIATAEGSVSYTIGQSFYRPIGNDEKSIMPGIQQAYRVTTVSTETPAHLNIVIGVFPNPTSDFITVRVDGCHPNVLDYKFFNMHGKVLFMGSFKSNEMGIDLSTLTPAVYLLQITSEKKYTNTYKIIKH